MKVVITEDKLYNVFSKFMDSDYDLSYYIRSREFIDKNNHPFGWLNGTVFMYGEMSDQLNLEGYFGDKTSKLLLTYLRDRFPDAPINFIE